MCADRRCGVGWGGVAGLQLVGNVMACPGMQIPEGAMVQAVQIVVRALEGPDPEAALQVLRLLAGTPCRPPFLLPNTLRIYTNSSCSCVHSLSLSCPAEIPHYRTCRCILQLRM